MESRPRGLRWVLVALVLGLTLPGAVAQAQEMEVGFDRPGGDLMDLGLARPDPTLCRAACEQEARCLAWTYLAAPAPGEAAHCYLKSEIPEPAENEQCTSGVRRAGIADKAGMEPVTNRPGGDFRDLALESPEPALCQRACNRDARCQAWTYVRPAGEGDAAHCWLKSERPGPVLDESCVSGVKARKETPTPEKDTGGIRV